MDSDLLALDTPVPVVDSRELPPAPGLLDLIGRNHNITSALADIVDNSIDARATTVLIRFLRKDARLVSVVVVDDGDGMDDTTIDQAMTIGATRSYGEGSLGHFGIGLKAASLGQAGSVTVLSRNRSGVPAVGRRLASKRSDRFECDVVDPTYASNALDRDWRHVSLAHGTVVKWDGVRTFPHTDDPTVTDQWIDETVRSICEHLGLVFHRLIAAGRVKIVVDVEDIATTECGLVFTVENRTSRLPALLHRVTRRSERDAAMSHMAGAVHPDRVQTRFRPNAAQRDLRVSRRPPHPSRGLARHHAEP
jgi:hypothetical protein